MFKKKPYFLIIDGHSYLYRVYYALPNIIDKFKNFSGAIYGFLKMIQKIYKKYKPKKMSIVFDSPKKNFRNNLFKKYKINRKPMPENLIYQFQKLCKIIKILKITTLIIPKVEADDVIGTIATKKKKKYRILIHSNDKDFAQLVNNKIKIIQKINCKPLGIKEIIKKYGIHPKKIIELFSLIGDTSDNVKGIKGIGKKTAIKLLNIFNSTKNIYKNIEKTHLFNIRNKKKIIENLKKKKKKLQLNQKLIKIKLNVKINFTLYSFKISNILNKKIVKIIQYYNFKNFTKYIKNF
ncbi:5'-3' exonuclease H3TH domain-containing protein [Buchnera aphidicola (Mollitrichosiphum nigrofasciatum)]|uniref:5'-3' exonuclease n=1 Tax=Buchnera aphidicola TaxID=9 RepID=UPI0031B88E8A